MPNTIITVARSYGSGGRTIGKCLAEKTGIDYYDRNLIYLASDKSGMDVRLFSEHDETVKKGLFEKLKLFSSNIPPENRQFNSRENIFRYQSKIIRELADKSDCVIIGRCANHTLRDSGHKLVRVFIWAPHSECVQTVMKKFSISEAEADKMIHDINKHRKEYFKYYTGCDWQSAENYDLSINTSELSEEQAVERIRLFAEIVKNGS